MDSITINKLIIGFIGAAMAISLKSLIDYSKKLIHLKKLKKILVTDLVHQLKTAGNFHNELEKLYEIYSKGSESILNQKAYNFYEELQTTLFNEVFFSDETFKTINKSDLLNILKNDSRAFGEIHNIYHIANKFQDRNHIYYEDLYDELLLSYMKGIDKKDVEGNLDALKKALRFITTKLNAEMSNTLMLSQLIYDYLIYLIGRKKLRVEYEIELVTRQNTTCKQN